MEKIKVIVVDDSAFMRRIISDMINSEKDMEVLDAAKNGEDLLEKLSGYKPDVITMDVEMPKLDGIQCLKRLKLLDINIPVIMLSSLSQKGAELTIECLESGAFDFVPKPSGSISLDIDKVKDELVQKIRTAYDRIRIRQFIIEKNEKYKGEIASDLSTTQRIKISKPTRLEAVVIGASTGGPKAIYTIITSLPEKIGVPVFVVQHMPVGFTKAFAERLNLNSKIKVVEAKDRDLIEKDIVYVAPGGVHMEVGSDKRIHLNNDAPLWGVRPAADKLFISASKVYGSKLASVVLTGMGKDGSMGTVEIKKNGGITLAQNAESSVIYGMPKAAFETGMVDEVLPLDRIADEVIRLVV